MFYVSAAIAIIGAVGYQYFVKKENSMAKVIVGMTVIEHFAKCDLEFSCFQAEATSTHCPLA